MTRIFAGIAVVAILSGVPAGAQTPAPAPQEAVPRASINLTLEQRHVIRELIKDLKIEPVKTATEPAVGDALPQDVTLRPMPPDVGRKVPQIRSHRFVVIDDRIVIVDPSENKVAELIELQAN
jgi:hypothetical protein